jgi:hypothetical protein
MQLLWIDIFELALYDPPSDWVGVITKDGHSEPARLKHWGAPAHEWVEAHTCELMAYGIRPLYTPIHKLG